jgi:alkanesulfonate monooxygenase SsuD/methylene tetrahydromethanopterin reductase-like flavin-dependent oxidoreductase (luciferase family)
MVLQAGASSQGIDLAAKYTDAVFYAEHSLTPGKESYRTIKSRAATVYGRNPDEILILPGRHLSKLGEQHVPVCRWWPAVEMS